MDEDRFGKKRSSSFLDNERFGKRNMLDEGRFGKRNLIADYDRFGKRSSQEKEKEEAEADELEKRR